MRPGRALALIFAAGGLSGCTSFFPVSLQQAGGITEVRFKSPRLVTLTRAGADDVPVRATRIVGDVYHKSGDTITLRVRQVDHQGADMLAESGLRGSSVRVVLTPDVELRERRYSGNKNRPLVGGVALVIGLLWWISTWSYKT